MKNVPQRRVVKSPFTREDRNGVFVTREESRNRRNKLARQRRTKENNKDKEYMDKINNQTEQEYKEELSRDMKIDAKYRSCDCSICDEAHELFQSDPDKFLEQRWQDYLEQINRKPCTDEELDKTFAEYGLVIDRQTGRVNNIK